MAIALSKTDKLVYATLGILLLIIISLLIYFNNQPSPSSLQNTSTFSSSQTLANNHSSIPKRVHIPINLSKDDILVSFRIDDITFEKKQKPVLENALYLARKYNITFDLAVIAQPFDQKADPEVFKLYEDNQDVFEIVAHGLTHKNPINSSLNTEFGGVLAEIQEDHIKKMKAIFVKHNLTTATKIFALPWSSGDNNTFKLAEKEGYLLITQSRIPENKTELDYNSIKITKVMVGVPMKEVLTESEIKLTEKELLQFTNQNWTYITFVTHTINFKNRDNSENLVKSVIIWDLNNKSIKYDLISNRLIKNE